MQQKDLESAAKLRGGYYTPEKISDFLVEWGFNLEKSPKNILEPSCGDGQFLHSLYRYSSNSKSSDSKIQFLGVELNEVEFDKSKKIFNKLKKDFNYTGKIKNSDFFKYMENTNDRIARKKFDLILGNPPYIRYQYFDQGKEVAEDNFRKLGIKTTKHANSWLYFLGDCVSRMSDDSRIGMVIPAELLHITYAKGLRKWLIEELDTTVLITFEELIFPNVQQEVVLFLGEKKSSSSTKTLKMIQKKNLKSLSSDIWDEVNKQAPIVLEDNDKWNCYFLEKSELDLCKKSFSKKNIIEFNDLANIKIGIVTGANKFFCINNEKLIDLNVSKRGSKGLKVLKVMGRSKDVAGLEFTKKDYLKNSKSGKLSNLLYFNPDFQRSKLSSQIKLYLNEGEEDNLHERYKCKIRKPWYWIPYVENSNISMYKRASEYNRLILNSAETYTTDTVHRISMKENSNYSAMDMCFSFINSLTFLSCELEGRNYGGGVLELVPGEIRNLKIPIYNCSEEEFKHLDSLLRKNKDIDTILDYTDEILLSFLSKRDRKRIRECWRKLQERRRIRGKSKNVVR